MAQVTLNIKDTLLVDEKDAISAMGGWTADVDDGNGGTIPNPISQDQFFKSQIKTWLRSQVIEYKQRQAVASVIVEEDN